MTISRKEAEELAKKYGHRVSTADSPAYRRGPSIRFISRSRERTPGDSGNSDATRSGKPTRSERRFRGSDD